MKRKLSISMAALLACVGLAGCAKTVNPEAYTYENGAPIASHIYQPAYTDGLVMDGEKDEAYGDDAVYRLYYQNKSSEARYMDTWLYYGVEGLYCFVEVKDNCVYFEPNRSVYYNSSIEVFFQNGAISSVNNDTCQWRISCTGTHTKHCGVKSRNSFTRSYFDGVCATKVNGTLNTNTCEGYTVEVFTPWYELGITDPSTAEIMYYCAFNRVTNANSGNTSRNRTTTNCVFQATPNTWVKTVRSDAIAPSMTSGANGVSTQKEGAFFGTFTDSKTKEVFRTHDVFDTSEDDGTANAKLTMTKASAHGYAFAKDSPAEYDKNSYFEITVKDVGGTSSPKIGLMVYASTNRIALYTKGAGTTGAPERTGIVQRTVSNGAWDWDHAQYVDTPNADFSAEVKMACYRKYVMNELSDGSFEETAYFYFFINDTLYYTNDTSVSAYGYNDLVFHDLGARKCYYGIYSASATATFENYSLLTETEADAKFNTLMGINA